MTKKFLKKAQDYLITFLVLSLALSVLQILNVNQVPKTEAAGNCAITSFSALPGTVSSGQSSTLMWLTSGCSTVYLLVPGNQNPPGQSVATDGSYSTGALSYIGQPYNYILNGFDSNGNETSDTATVNVTQQAAYCTISSFNASPQSVSAGNSSNLGWNTANCNSASIDNGIGSVGTSGTKSVSPSQTTTYTLTAYGLVSGPTGPVGGSVTATAIVNVTQSGNGCNGVFNASQNPVLSGGSSNLSWSISGCDVVSLQGINNANSTIIYSNQGESPTGGYSITNITQQETWTLTGTITSTGAQQQWIITINVNNACSVTKFTATNVTSGNPSTLSWTTQNCTSVHLSGGEYSNNTNGYTLVGTGGTMQTSALTQTTTYYLQGFSNYNSSLISQATATVSGQNCTITVSRSLNSGSGTITSGGSYQGQGNGSTFGGSTDNTPYTVIVPSTGSVITVTSSTGGTGTVAGQSWNIIPSTGDAKTCSSSNSFSITTVPQYKTAAKLNVQ